MITAMRHFNMYLQKDLSEFRVNLSKSIRRAMDCKGSRTGARGSPVIVFLHQSIWYCISVTQSRVKSLKCGPWPGVRILALYAIPTVDVWATAFICYLGM
jgi:hypothetical protein